LILDNGRVVWQAFDGADYEIYAADPVAVVDTTPPSAPTNLAFSLITSNSLTVSWTASIDNVGGSGLKGYLVYYCVGLTCPSGIWSVGQPTVTTLTSQSITGLAACTGYSFYVNARDNVDNNVNSTISTATTAGCTTAKSDLTISAIALSNTKMSMGGSIGVRVTMKNVSTTTATQTASAISAGIYVASNSACTTGLQQVTSTTKSIVMVAAGSKLAYGASVTKPTSTTYTTVSIPSSGYSHGSTAYVCVKADNNGTTSNAGVETEVSETNNWTSKAISMM
jgi:hypothetical protein